MSDTMIISSLGSVIVAMAGYIIYLHKEHAKELKKMLVASIESGNKMASVTENNSQLISKLLDKL